MSIYIPTGEATGGDTITTGTGLDTVTVTAHTNPDTFGFALGTTASSYTMVTGAHTGDQVITASHNLAGTSNSNLHDEGTGTNLTSMYNAVIGAISADKGQTYIGSDGFNTFIVTDVGGTTATVGVIELVGVVFDSVATLRWCGL